MCLEPGVRVKVVQQKPGETIMGHEFIIKEPFSNLWLCTNPDGTGLYIFASDEIQPVGE